MSGAEILTQTLHHSLVLVVLIAFLAVEPVPTQAANALETYVHKPDTSFAWHVTKQTSTETGTVTQVNMRSQTWRGHDWSHQLNVIRPQTVRHPEVALLVISGDHNDPSAISLWQALADRAGAVVAEVTRVPNQPLFEGRKEDALLAYTFDQYVHTGDETWPALFPMTKSAVRAMDTVQEWAQEAHGQTIETFVVTGASKRGWTTWLTGAVDSRVTAIAPMVIDVLNMKAQTEWAEKIYGQPSDKLSDYAELNLTQQMDTPPMQKLRSWVDPYSYRARYTMPKLLLLGTNDPYWTVDALRHYWDDLPEPKLLFQTPNAGHKLGPDAMETLAAFFQMIAEKEGLPTMQWRMAANGEGRLEVSVNRPAKAIRLWTADSAVRDFRQATWRARELDFTPGSSHASTVIEKPAGGFRAFMGEVVVTSSTGHEYKLSTQVQVMPDDVR